MATVELLLALDVVEDEDVPMDANSQLPALPISLSSKALAALMPAAYAAAVFAFSEEDFGLEEDAPAAVGAAAVTGLRFRNIIQAERKCTLHTVLHTKTENEESKRTPRGR